MKKALIYIMVALLLPVMAMVAQRRPTVAEAQHAAERLRQQADSSAGEARAKALFNLAAIYDRGFLPLPVDSLTGDTLRTLSLYREAADLGYPAAMNHLGFLLMRGEGVEADVDSGMRLIEKAAIIGDPKAANNLGYFLIEGKYVQQDYEKARFWLEKAAQSGLPTALAQLADMSRQGLGGKADTIRATELYEQAIRGGLHDAEAKLISMNIRRWLQLPTDSAYALGRRYYLGSAPTAGVQLLKMVIESEKSSVASPIPNPQSSALALLGDAYSRGVGVPYSHEKSTEYYLLAARAGNPSAQFIIAELLDIFPDALMYLTDSEDENNPVYWYVKAAEGGVTTAAEASRLLSN